MRQKVRDVSRELKNLEKLCLNISDNYSGKYVGVPTWIHFVHSIPSLKTLQVNLYSKTWKEFYGQLFRKNILPYLECLTLSSLKGCLDFKMLISVSKKISSLELDTALTLNDDDEEFSWNNLEQTDLRGLKMLAFDHQMLDVVQWTHIISELEARPEFIVKYPCYWDIQMAEKLVKWLTLPNFDWDYMEATSDEEYERAVQLCTKNCIDLSRIIYL